VSKRGFLKEGLSQGGLIRSSGPSHTPAIPHTSTSDQEGDSRKVPSQCCDHHAKEMGFLISGSLR
jgi:hypothetical protein